MDARILVADEHRDFLCEHFEAAAEAMSAGRDRMDRFMEMVRGGVIVEDREWLTSVLAENAELVDRMNDYEQAVREHAAFEHLIKQLSAEGT
jgi:hypothetical protein